MSLDLFYSFLKDDAVFGEHSNKTMTIPLLHHPSRQFLHSFIFMLSGLP